MALSVDSALSKALKHEKKFEWQSAAAIYRAILDDFPNNTSAIKGYNRALDRVNKPPSVLSEPPQEETNALLHLYTAGQFERALSSAQRLLKAFPRSFSLLNFMGALYLQKKDFASALDLFKNIVSLNPQYPEAHNNMGIAWAGIGNVEAALDCYKTAVHLKPDYCDAHYNLGNALSELDQFQQAINAYKQGLAHNFEHVETHYNLGNALARSGDFSEAIIYYQHAITRAPDYVDAYNNMGRAKAEVGDQTGATDCYLQALRLNPDCADAYNNMGLTLADQDQLQSAINLYRKALAIQPDTPDVLYNLGVTLNKVGDLKAAFDHFRRGVKVQPENASIHSQKLYQQALMCDWPGIAEDQQALMSLGLRDSEVEPFILLSLEDAPERHRLRAATYAQKKFSQNPLIDAPRPSKKPERLRIGYFSADFHEHPVAYLMAKILELHDRDQFAIYAYSFGANKADAMRSRLIEAVDTFADVRAMTDKEVALLARSDEIDIAIDLTGYTQNNRTGIFACRAAAIQINFLGYPGTMGADFMDYIIADKNLIPDRLRHHYSENILCMPHAYMPTDNTRKISSRALTRADMGLPEDAFVFCCFNDSYKIKEMEFGIWMRLLRQISGSVLWLRKANHWFEANLIAEAEKRHIDPARLIFADRIPMDEHLARHTLADLFLDTFAFNAHTTATEALWAGLPLVTKVGQGFATRVAASLLSAVGLPELITETAGDYEALILALATDPHRLAAIRQKLAANRLSAPLFDTELFTRHLENGYQQAYQNYFEGQPSENITVGAKTL